MKFRFALSLLLVLGTSGAAFAGQFGPAAPAARSGEISQEIGYFRSVAEWTTDEPGFTDGVMTMNQAYLQAGYGLAGGWEGYLRLGGSDLQQENAFAVDDSEMKDSVAPFLTVGARCLLYDGKVFDVGMFLQGTYFAPFEDSKTALVGGTIFQEELELKNLWDINLGLALQANIGKLVVYAGPLAYHGGGRLEAKVVAGGISDSSAATYEERGNVGAVAGLNLRLARNFNLSLEGQYKSRLSAGGAVTYLRFSY